MPSGQYPCGAAHEKAPRCSGSRRAGIPPGTRRLGLCQLGLPLRRLYGGSRRGGARVPAAPSCLGRRGRRATESRPERLQALGLSLRRLSRGRDSLRTPALPPSNAGPVLGAVVKHGTSGYRKGCRCEVCSAAYREMFRAWRKGRAAAVQAKQLEPPSHGTWTYTNWGCRCDVCRAAHAEKRQAGRQRRLARLAAGAEPPNHGENGYNHWGCRCPVCREAKAQSNRQRVRRRTQNP